MICLGCWNIRGLNFSPKQKEIRDFINTNSLCIVAILESHVHSKNLNKVCCSIFGNWRWSSNNKEESDKARIIIGWDSSFIDVVILDWSDQVVHCAVSADGGVSSVFCSFVYAANCHYRRKQLWSSIVAHKDIVKDYPWIILGDFNVALSLDESTSGGSRILRGMADFLDCVNMVEIQDINRNGLNFTWNQRPNANSGVSNETG